HHKSVPFSMGKIIDLVTSPDTSSDNPNRLSLTQVFVLLAVLFSVGALANTGRVMLMRITGERIIARLRVVLYEQILRQDMAFFDTNRSGDLISRLTVDANIVGKSLSNNISDGLR